MKRSALAAPALICAAASANAQSFSAEVLFRLYGPEKPLFDKTWQLSDIEPTESR
jgi:hypothetical protein